MEDGAPLITEPEFYAAYSRWCEATGIRSAGRTTDVIASVMAVALSIHLFVVFYEEPTLRGKFGDDYLEYCRNVRRWWPRMRAWQQNGT